ncbi:hypothetical protein [Glycomyces terrestris]|nr:hypothetical protein [Glycomyces terrestris]
MPSNWISLDGAVKSSTGTPSSPSLNMVPTVSFDTTVFAVPTSLKM